MVVLSIGLTSVVALFPVGINRVRNATLDVRTTIMASNAVNLFDIKCMANDPGLIDWPVYDANTVTNNGGIFTLDDPYRNPLSFIPYASGVGGWGTAIPCDHGTVLTTPLNFKFSTLFLPGPLSTTLTAWQQSRPFFITASNTQLCYYISNTLMATPLVDANSNFDSSYPVLLDPWLYDQMAFSFGMMNPTNLQCTNGVPRITIATQPLRNDGSAIPGLVGYYYSIYQGNVNPPYCDIAVLSLSEMTLLPPSISTTFSNTSVRSGYGEDPLVFLVVGYPVFVRYGRPGAQSLRE